jgi:pyruvate dehydrogenase E2 component (dihydrolipoamide acetyltransferase)
MAREILMPKLGLTMKTGTVMSWFKDVGDPVAEKEPVLEIETEKLSHQIESPAKGVLIKKIAVTGEKYPIACVLGYVGAEGEQIETGGAFVGAGSDAGIGGDISAGTGIDTGGRVFISPIAKKLAESLGIDYGQIRGTGPNGRIVKDDVRKYADAKAASTVHKAVDDNYKGSSVDKMADDTYTGSSVYKPADSIYTGMDQIIPYAGMRKAIGDSMSLSWTTAPMVTHHVTADVTELVEYRAKLNSGLDKDKKVSVNGLILKFTATALAEMPIINSTLTDEGIVTSGSVHLGMATAIPGGLVVPVIRNADRKSLLQISSESKELATRARDGTLGFSETTGGTFTVTNLGGYGSVDFFTPIINPPQAAILGVGRIVEAAVPVSGEIMIRSMMGLSFTYDHRIIDGATAAEFMASFLKLIENPIYAVLL